MMKISLQKESNEGKIVQRETDTDNMIQGACFETWRHNSVYKNDSDSMSDTKDC
jgi:hypothetical protein